MDRPGGGVAILIHKSLQFSPLSLPHLETIEVVGVSIALRNNSNKLIDILSVYIPNGNSCSEEELTSLTTGRNNFIIGGDFNGHHGRWETSCNLPNQSGRALANILENTTNIELATPTNLGTRLNPISLTYSTIDLTLMAPHLAISSEITRGPHLSSDHLPLHIRVQADPTLSIERAPTWNLKDADWITWNKEISTTITSSLFYSSESPDEKYQIYLSALLDATKSSGIILTRTPDTIKSEPSPPWWDIDCRKAVAMARKARNRCDPSKGGVMCSTNKEAWKEKENEKKRIILKAKKTSMNNFINTLSPKSNSTKTWAFAKAWTSGTKAPDLNSSPIEIDPETNQIVTLPKEKSKNFLIPIRPSKRRHPRRPKARTTYQERNPLNRA
uniref:Endonuclease/exonuclease/phosphatase domain-containing protein n=1 Tax=Daphnia galeata TaxID=27404 RepID=A0A8J2WKS4_9CRUS|nr:unnamed protein product [Daphnia galeata]